MERRSCGRSSADWHCRGLPERELAQRRRLPALEHACVRRFAAKGLDAEFGRSQKSGQRVEYKSVSVSLKRTCYRFSRLHFSGVDPFRADLSSFSGPDKGRILFQVRVLAFTADRSCLPLLPKVSMDTTKTDFASNKASVALFW